jgi:hypothetical protein
MKSSTPKRTGLPKQQCVGQAFYLCTLLGAHIHWCDLLDVRYAPIATKRCIAAKCLDVPQAEVTGYQAYRSWFRSCRGRKNVSVR